MEHQTRHICKKNCIVKIRASAEQTTESTQAFVGLRQWFNGRTVAAPGLIWNHGLRGTVGGFGWRGFGFCRAADCRLRLVGLGKVLAVARLQAPAFRIGAVIFRFRILCASEILGQAVPPPPFYPYTRTTVAYPDSQVLFELAVPAEFELLAASSHSNVLFGGGRQVVIRWWMPSRSAVGPTNQFIVRTTAGGSPALSVTGLVSFVVIDVPLIRSIISSNGHAML